MTYNGFEFNKLDFLKKNIDDPKDGIPSDYGIYQWVYWPEFDPLKITQPALLNLLKEYSAQNFYIEEEIKGTYKFHAKIWEQGYRDNSNIFGLSGSKSLELERFLNVPANLVSFSVFFQEICFVRPFYLGKANNLRSRLQDHFNSKSNVMPEIVAKGVAENQIWVGYKTMPYNKTEARLNNIFEEIYSRRVKPGLSIKPN
jgi:hypothetical protein